MTAYEPISVREPRGVLRWLSFRRQPDDIEAVPEIEAEEALDLRERRRRQLLADVNSFLLTHRLEISPYTLAIAHDVITGADQLLARRIAQRVAERTPITLEWLEEAGRVSGSGDGSAQLNAMMVRLESSLADFATTTNAARSATTAYSSALETHVGELEQVSKAGVVISELATIAKIMLERTRQIEQEMSRSELQTRQLQSSLDEARRKADRDHLTGLPNRRAFEAVLARELAVAEQSGEPLCVAFCDIDHFKKINDSHGHEAGDRVLRVVAQTLARISNDKCHVARHGGEEFVVLFRGKSIVEAFADLDRARKAMAERKLVNRATDMPFGAITFSAGLADILAFDSHREALRAADEALYGAKAAGRNRIELARRRTAHDLVATGAN